MSGSDRGEDGADHAENDGPGPTGDGVEDEESWDVSLADLGEDPGPEPIDPGSPSPEHVAFVLLGVLLTLAVIYRLVELVGATIA